MTLLGAEQRPDTEQAVATLRARGADPVRLRHIEALARRAARHAGTARRLLDQLLQQRLQQLLQDTRVAHGSQQGGSQQGARPEPTPPQATATTEPFLRTGPLTELLAHIARHSATPATGNNTQNHSAAAVPELKAVRDYRATWSRLHGQRRLTQALHQVPDNAGPLNTQRLLHQALAVMHDASPAYLQCFMAQVEALLWLEQLNGGAAATKKGRPSKTKPG